jgi:hypothetical protein
MSAERFSKDRISSRIGNLSGETLRGERCSGELSSGRTELRGGSLMLNSAISINSPAEEVKIYSDRYMRTK